MGLYDFMTSVDVLVNWWCFTYLQVCAPFLWCSGQKWIPQLCLSLMTKPSPMLLLWRTVVRNVWLRTSLGVSLLSTMPRQWSVSYHECRFARQRAIYSLGTSVKTGLTATGTAQKVGMYEKQMYDLQNVLSRNLYSCQKCKKTDLMLIE